VREGGTGSVIETKKRETFSERKGTRKGKNHFFSEFLEKEGLGLLLGRKKAFGTFRGEKLFPLDQGKEAGKAEAEILH